MTQLRAGAGTLSRAAGHVTEARADLDRLSAELRAGIEGLRGVWDGAGAVAFTRLGQRWADQQRLIVGALDDFERSLQQTERDNTATDEAIGSSFARLAARLS